VRTWLCRIVFFCSLLACTYLVAQSAQSPQAQPSDKSSRTAKAGLATEGDKRFQEHCGRCHHLPEDLSPREARAVVRQMRVRAMLSAEDEKFILEYIAP
jgi:cytochrome c5